MFFVVYCLDKPFSSGLRSVTRDQHLTFIRDAGRMVRFAGPLMDEHGERMVGSLLIVEAESLDQVRGWSAEDPYAKVGLFETVEIHPWKFLIENGQAREA